MFSDVVESVCLTCGVTMCWRVELVSVCADGGNANERVKVPIKFCDCVELAGYPYHKALFTARGGGGLNLNCRMWKLIYFVV